MKEKIVGHYDRTGDQKLPLPRVQKTKKVGNTVQHKLVYDDDPTLDVWVPLSEYTDLTLCLSAARLRRIRTSLHIGTM